MVFDFVGNSLTGDFAEVVDFGKFGVLWTEFKDGASDGMIGESFAGDE